MKQVDPPQDLTNLALSKKVEDKGTVKDGMDRSYILFLRGKEK